MSEHFTILKNKGELFKCQLNIEGAEVKDTTVRLCLEFDDNKNMHFYGKIGEDGSCCIEIPKLEEVKKEVGKLVIEVIADSMFFKLYECDVDLRNSVEIKMVHKETTVAKSYASSSKKIGLTKIIQERSEENVENPVVEKQGKKGLPNFNDYIRKKL